MKIAITDQAKLVDFPVFEGSWTRFHDTLKGFGHEVVSLKDDPDAVVFMNAHREFWGMSLQKIDIRKRILVLWEPPSVKTLNFNSRELSRFGLIFTPSTNWISGKNVQSFNWPQSSRPLDCSNWRNRKRKLIAVWGNKFSQHENSLYHLRRAAAFALHEDLDLYGRGWESKSYAIKQFSRSLFQSKGKIQEWTLRDALESVKPPPNYRGELISKETKMREYKFALVIENSKDYVSEKLIEAITQGLVPVYVGPKLSDFGLPDNISVNAEPTLASIVEACMYLLKDSEHEHAKLLENAKIFLASENFESFRNDNVLSKLAQDICVHLAGV